MRKAESERISVGQQSFAQGQKDQMKKQNTQLKKEIDELKQAQYKVQKQLELYRQVLFNNADSTQILEMQHSKIFQLETQLQILQNRYDKMGKASNSSSQMEYAVKCKELEKRLKEREVEYQKHISVLREELMKLNASEIYGSKNVVMTSPSSELKKTPLGGRKFL